VVQLSRSVDNRPSLGLRVGTSIKREYEETIQEKYGSVQPYAAIELERELEYYLGEGDLNDLSRAIDELSDRLDSCDGKEKNNSARSRARTETTVVQYHIQHSIQQQIRNQEDYRTPGNLVEDIMFSYAQHEGTIRQEIGRIKRLAEQLEFDEMETDSQSTTERRIDAIIQGLSGKSQFTLEDFEDAVRKISTIDSTPYIKNKYLPKVVDKMGCTWHPKRENLFINEDKDWIPEYRDPRNKSKWLMTEDDERLAIKIDAFNTANGRGSSYSVEDARIMLNSNPQKNKIKQLMKDIADSSPGYKYSSDREELLARRKIIKRYTKENTDILNRINDNSDNPV